MLFGSSSPRLFAGFQGENLNNFYLRIQIVLPLYELWFDGQVYQESKEREAPGETNLVNDSAFHPREECF